MSGQFDLVEVESIPKRKPGGHRKTLAQLLEGSIATVRKNPGKAFRIALYDSPHTASRAANRLGKAIPDVHFVSRKVAGENGSEQTGIFAQVKSKDATDKPQPAKAATKKAGSK